MQRHRRPAPGDQPVHPLRGRPQGPPPHLERGRPGDLAEPLVDEVVAQLRALGATVATGRFGAQMRVSLTNDGPFTVLLEM